MVLPSAGDRRGGGSRPPNTCHPALKEVSRHIGARAVRGLAEVEAALGRSKEGGAATKKATKKKGRRRRRKKKAAAKKRRKNAAGASVSLPRDEL